MKIFANEKELITHLKDEAKTTKNVYIGIDGTVLSGKSVLSEKISNKLHLPTINLDNYVEHDKKNYVSKLRYNKLRERINSIKGSFIIEGVCLLNVIEKLSIQLTHLIYIKVVNERGEWLDEEECNPKEPVEDLINKLENQTRIVSQCLLNNSKNKKEVGLTSLQKEIIRYHDKVRPFKKADIIFKRLKKD